VRGIIVVSHNQMAAGLISTCDMIVGHHHHCQYLGLNEDGVNVFSEELYKNLDDMLEKYDEVIALADIKGGTPFNQLLRYKLEKNIERMYIISGVNIPLLIQLMVNIDNDQETRLIVEEAISVGQESILLETLEEKQDNEFDDILD